MSLGGMPAYHPHCPDLYKRWQGNCWRLTQERKRRRFFNNLASRKSSSWFISNFKCLLALHLPCFSWGKIFYISQLWIIQLCNMFTNCETRIFISSMLIWYKILFSDPEKFKKSFFLSGTSEKNICLYHFKTQHRS